MTLTTSQAAAKAASLKQHLLMSLRIRGRAQSSAETEILASNTSVSKQFYTNNTQFIYFCPLAGDKVVSYSYMCISSYFSLYQ